ncbi:MAG TPA: cysteine hydrolase [Alphaproteobacteria bacterium]|jgi:nicotinamidase-related amidase
MPAHAKLVETLGPSHTALVLFDSLNGYLHPKNPKKQAFLAERNILPNMARLLKGARKAGLTTFYPMGAHTLGGVDVAKRLTDTDMDLRPWGKKRETIRVQFYSGSDESEIAPELAPLATDVTVPKHRWSSFFQTRLELSLRVRGLDTIVLAGGSTDVGIASTAFAARDLDLELVVVRDACYSARGDNSAFFMDRVFPRMGRVVTVDEAVALMRKGAKGAKKK